MDRKPLPKNISPELEAALKDFMDEALGSPILLSAAPTTADETLKVNQVGYFSNNIYWNINGTVYRIALTAV